MKNERFEMNDFEQMTPYQAFVSSLFRMGRDTKILKRNGFKQAEIPLIRVAGLDGRVTEIMYLAESSVWGISVDGSEIKHFNPTTYTGVLDFMLGYHAQQLKDACIEMVASFEKIMKRDEPKRIPVKAKTAMAS